MGAVDTEISRGSPAAQELRYLSPYQIVLQPAGSLTETARTTQTSAFANRARAARRSRSSHPIETPNEAHPGVRLEPSGLGDTGLLSEPATAAVLCPASLRSPTKSQRFSRSKTCPVRYEPVITRSRSQVVCHMK